MLALVPGILLGQDSPTLKLCYLSPWQGVFQLKTLLVEKPVIVEVGESQPWAIRKSSIMWNVLNCLVIPRSWWCSSVIITHTQERVSIITRSQWCLNILINVSCDSSCNQDGVKGKVGVEGKVG